MGEYFATLKPLQKREAALDKQCRTEYSYLLCIPRRADVFFLSSDNIPSENDLMFLAYLLRMRSLNKIKFSLSWKHDYSWHNY